MTQTVQPTARTLVAFVVVAVVSTALALFLGEYEFDFPTPVVAGLLLAAVLGELTIAIARQRHVVIGLYVGLASALAIVLAGAIDANDVEPIKGWVWVGALVALATGYLRGAPPAFGRKARERRAADSAP